MALARSLYDEVALLDGPPRPRAPLPTCEDIAGPGLLRSELRAKPGTEPASPPGSEQAISEVFDVNGDCFGDAAFVGHDKRRLQ